MKKGFLSLLFLLGVCVLMAQTPEEATVPTEEPALEHPSEAMEPAKVEALTPDQRWDQANTAYINANYAEAITLYEALLSEGLVSAKLYYNLANAYFKQGALGEAILYYHRALRLAPGNEDIRYNLRVAESRTKDSIQQIPAFFLVEWVLAVRHLMSCAAWSLLSMALLVAGLLFSLLYLLARRLSLRKAGFYGTLLMALLFVVTTWFALGERREMLNDRQAVVMSATASVKSSPDRSATDLFLLHEGTLVEITTPLEEWCEVVIADGKKGWLERRTIEII